MKMRIVLTICLIALVGCSGAQLERAAKPAFKGIELYSWNPGDGKLHFCLFPGTNRQKTSSEITNSEVAIVGIDTLKQRLSALAKGEIVFWRSVANEPVPSEAFDELYIFCQGLDVKLEKQ
jgi:hypothetical protein